MGTKNSGISAKLSLDSSPFEKGLRKAEKELKNFTTSLKGAEPMKLAGEKMENFTRSTRNAVNEMQRLKLATESISSNTAQGVKNAERMAQALQRGLNMGAGPARNAPMRSSPWSPAGPSSPWFPQGTASPWFAPGSSSPWRPEGQRGLPAAQTPQAMAAAASAARTRVYMLDNGVTSRFASDEATKKTERYAAAQRKAREEMTATGTAGNRLGMTLLNLGYVTDDLQYGLRGVMNNIAPLVMGMGLGAGLAGVIQVLAVGIAQSTKYWDEWTGATRRAEKAARDMANFQRTFALDTARSSASGAAEGAGFALRGSGFTAGMASQQAAAGRQSQIRDALRGAGTARARAVRARVLGNRTDPVLEARANLTSLRLGNEAERADAAAELAQREGVMRGNQAAAAQQFNATAPELNRNRNRLDILRGGAGDRDARIESMTKAISDATSGGGAKGAMEAVRLEGERAPLLALAQEQARLEKLVPEQEKLLEGLRKFLDGNTEREMELADARALEAARDEERKALEAEAEAHVKNAESAKQWRKAMSMAEGAVNRLANSVRNVWNALERTRELNNEKINLGISEIRNPRRRARVQRAKNVADETQRLLRENPRMDPAEAADMAERAQTVQDRENGVRTIRRRESSDGPRGLDAFDFSPRGIDSMRDAPVPVPARENARRRGQAALDRVAADVAKTGGRPQSEAERLLQEILTTLQTSAKTPAERNQPLRKN